MKILFSGYRVAGYECLKYLLEQNEDIVGVLTRDDDKDPTKIDPDKSVMELAKLNGLKIFEPTDKEELLAWVNEIKPDVHLSAFYSNMVPPEVIKAIPFNINIHGGKLPEYKGCFSPIWAILNGEKITEVTLQLMGSEIDSGEIIKSVRLTIGENETGGELYYRITDTVIKLFIEIYNKIKNGENIITKPQPEGGNYYKRGLPNNGYLSLYTPAKKAYNFIRALDFPPLEPAHTTIGGKKIYLYAKKVEK